MGNVAYTTTWVSEQFPATPSTVWDVRKCADSRNTVLVPNARRWATFRRAMTDSFDRCHRASALSIMIYSLGRSRNPQLITRYSTALTNPGVQPRRLRCERKALRVLSIDPLQSTPARLVIVDITDPAAPTQAFTAIMGGLRARCVRPRMGSCSRRSGIKEFTIWDLGGAGSGSVSNPIVLGSLAPVTECPPSGVIPTRYGRERTHCREEAPVLRLPASGDIHVVDVSTRGAERGCVLSPRCAGKPTIFPSTKPRQSYTRLITTGC